MSDVLFVDENLDKLKLETQNLAILKATSQQCCDNTEGIRNILSEFDDRLAKLERDIQPVYKETGDLQSKQTKLAKTLERLDHVIQFYSVTREVNDIIRAGPANQLQSYMQCLKRLKVAIQYFSQNNPESPEYMNVSSLFKYGCDAVEREFKLILQRYSSPIAPITLQDIVDDDSFEHQLDSNATTTSQPDLPSDKIEDLRVMCEWLCYNCNESLINTYADIRSDYVCKSLKSLQDFKKSQTIPNSLASNSSRGSIDSPDLGLNKKRFTATNSRDGSNRKTPKSIPSAFMKKFHNVIPGEVKMGPMSFDDITITEREIVTYLTCITAFHKMAVLELNLMSSIVPADLKIPVYNRLIQDSLKLIATDANNLTTRVKKSTAKHDFTSALNLFPILKYQTMRRHNFDLLFDGCQSEPLDKFKGLTVIFQTTISKSLEEFASYVQNYSDIKVPDDGTVHELTNNVMIFIEQLQPHLNLMSTVINIKDKQAMENGADKNIVGFAQYIARLLVSLEQVIMRMAETYTNMNLIFIFKINNFQYILKRLKESKLLEILNSYIHKVEEYFENLIEEAKNGYLASLAPVIGHLRDLQESKPKSIKERFSGFNKDFEELSRLNKYYAVPDLELRMDLREECKKVISNYYRQFYNYYMNLEFSKNKEKYMKFTPELVNSMIDQFFESN